MGQKTSKDPMQMAQNTTNQPIQMFKIVFLGDEAVGKTCIINRFIFNNFNENEKFTLGVDLINKTVEVDNLSIRLQFWDTAGKEEFRTLIPSYIRDSQAAIICYDITNEKSFQSIPSWIEMVKEERGNEAYIYILGNKTDLEQNRQVPTDQAEAKAKELGALFSEVSAQSGNNVTEFFKKFAFDLEGNPSYQGSTSVQQQQPEQPQEHEGLQQKQSENQDEKQQ